MNQKKVIPTGSPELRKRLPRGAVKALAEKYGYSWMWVHSLVTGKAKGDPRVIAHAIRLATIEDKRRAQLEQEMQVESVSDDNDILLP